MFILYIIAQTCTEAGKNPGGCVWSPTTSCFIFGGRCYCDSYCRYFDDCCDDVSSAMSQWGKLYNIIIKSARIIIIFLLWDPLFRLCSAIEK